MTCSRKRSLLTGFSAALFSFLLYVLPVAGQEVLQAAKVQAKAGRKNLPSLGLPIRTDGVIDNVIRFRNDRWEGSDSLGAAPRWTVQTIKPENQNLPEALAPVYELCCSWANEKPKGITELVFGPCQGGWYIAFCKKTHSVLGWKSIAFMLPSEGINNESSIYSFAHSVNWLERRIGYNLFPKLPDYIQEIIEEMTATELLCPYQEFDPGLIERPEFEIEYDREEDYNDM